MGESLLIGFSGYRGGGKSLAMTWLSLIEMQQGRPCWSNYEIKATIDGKVYEARPLQLKLLWTLDASLQGGLIIVDEIQGLASGRRAASNNNMLMNRMIEQIRKRDISMLYGCKLINWVDPVIRYETDLEINCRDLVHDPWGRERKLGKGKVFELTFRELSGCLTGHCYFEDGREVKLTLHGGQHLWDAFDSYKVVDIWEGMTQIVLKKPKMQISWGQEDGESEMGQAGGYGPPQPPKPVGAGRQRRQS